MWIKIKLLLNNFKSFFKYIHAYNNEKNLILLNLCTCIKLKYIIYYLVYAEKCKKKKISFKYFEIMFQVHSCIEKEKKYNIFKPKYIHESKIQNI